MVWVLRDLDPSVIALVRPRSNCMSKLQTHPPAREGALQQETRIVNTEKRKEKLVTGPRWVPDTKTDWPTSGQSSWLNKRDVLCFLWRTNWIYICYIEESKPSLWSSVRVLQIQRSGFDSRRYQIFWEVVSLERGPLSLVSTIEELLGRESSGFGLEIREYGRSPSRWPRSSPYPQKLVLTSPTSGGRSAGIVRSRTQAIELFLV
jgi:hypothetical protein